MTAKPDTTLHAAFSSLKERGFTPKIQYLEVFERYPGSARTPTCATTSPCSGSMRILCMMPTCSSSFSTVSAALLSVPPSCGATLS